MATTEVSEEDELQQQYHNETEMEEGEEGMEEEEESPDIYQKIHILESHGIAANDITKFADAGYHTIESIAHATKRKLSDIKGISETKVLKIKEIVKTLVPMEFQTAADALENRKELVMLTTGSRDIDKEGSFRPERLKAIAEKFQLDPIATLENVAVARAHNSEHQMELLKVAAAIMAQDRYALSVVDSATALFRTDYTGRGELSERQIQMGQFLRQLTRLAEEFGVSVFITNQVVANPDGMSFAKDATKPIGGNIIAHAATTRLRLRKGRGENRIMTVYDSPSLPEADCQFALSAEGVCDATE